MRAYRSQITLCSVSVCIFTYLNCAINGTSTLAGSVYVLRRYFYVLMTADGCSSKRHQPWEINEGLLFALAPACRWFLFEWDTGCQEHRRFIADSKNWELKAEGFTQLMVSAYGVISNVLI